MIILVNDIPFSNEIWSFYNKRQHRWQDIARSNYKINVFRQFIKDPELQQGVNAIQTYQELTAEIYFEIVYDVFLLMSDLGQKPLSTYVSLLDLEREISYLEDLSVYWSVTHNHPKERIGKIDYTFVVGEDGLNLKFASHLYCMIQVMWDRLNNLKRILSLTAKGPGTEAKHLQMFDAFRHRKSKILNYEFAKDDEGFDHFMKSVIRVAYGGDFDEFIEAVISKIQEEKMCKYHELLAKIRGNELMGITKTINDPIAPHETWRRLFNSYFDEIEDSFDLFFPKYVAESFFFLCYDYLALRDFMGITYVPVYRIFSESNFEVFGTSEIRRLIDTAAIRKRVFELYKIKIK